MRPLTAARAAVVAVLAVVALAPGASAQTSLGGMNVQGDVAAGVRFYLLEPPEKRKGKLEEYRDLPTGTLLDHVRLRLVRPDESYAVDFGGDKWGQQDQHLFLGAGRLGRSPGFPL